MPVSNAAGTIINNLPQRNSKRQLINTGLFYVSAYAEKSHSPVFFRSQFRKPITASLNNKRKVGKRFHIIDHSRTTEQPHHSGKGWLKPRITFFSFQRFQKRGFFPADISTRPAVNHNVKMKRSSKNIRAEKSLLISCLDSLFNFLIRKFIFAADINVSFMNSHRIGSDDHAFD